MGDRRHRFVYTNMTYRETSGNARMEVLSMSTDYKRHAELQDRERTKELLKELPPFCTEYYKGRNLKLSAKTQYNYAFKMSVFLRYLHESNSYFGSKEIWDITLDDLDHLNRDDIEDFMEWLSGQKTGRNRGAATNSSSTVLPFLFKHLLAVFCIQGEVIKKSVYRNRPKRCQEKEYHFFGSR